MPFLTFLFLSLSFAHRLTRCLDRLYRSIVHFCEVKLLQKAATIAKGNELSIGMANASIHHRIDEMILWHKYEDNGHWASTKQNTTKQYPFHWILARTTRKKRNERNCSKAKLKVNLLYVTNSMAANQIFESNMYGCLFVSGNGLDTSS